MNITYFNIGYYLILSIGLIITLLLVGFILKKTIFKNLMEEEDEEFED